MADSPHERRFSEEDSIAFGFYSLLETAKGDGYLGALLVTDSEGVPGEFRVTYPVKPNLVQRQLYGDSLVPHIGVELCGVPLVEALGTEIALLLVDSMDLLALAERVSIPVVYVARPGESISVEGETEREGERELLYPSFEGFDPIQVVYPPSIADTRKAEVFTLLQHLSQRVDAAEPFDRIHVAVKELADMEKRFA